MSSPCVAALRRHWPLAVALVALWTTLAAVLVRSLAQNAGHLVYDVDDPYIHMAIAKHVVQDGVWGVTPYAFSSASSSVLWPLVLVGIYAIVGVNETPPLVLNVVAATALLAIAHRLLRRCGRAAQSVYVLGVLLAIVYLTPLPALVFSGHEHVAHAALTVAFSGAAAATLARPLRSSSLRLLGLGPLLVGVRYEGLFLVAVTCGLLLLQRRARLAVGLAGLAVLPAVAIGLVSMASGWFALPTSLVLKGRLLGLAPGPEAVVRLGRDVYHDLLASPHLLLVLVAALAVLGLLPERAARPELFGLVLLSGAVALHGVFAGRVRWFYRHDAYLVALGLAMLAPALDAAWRASCPRLRSWPAISTWTRGLGLGLLAGFFVLPVAWRGGLAFAQRAGSVAQVARATSNIYEQQYQMGMFLQQHYAGASVALNDVGAANFLADLRLLDLYGLASLDVARLKLSGHFDRPHLAALAKASGVRIAIVYDHWFQDEDGSSLLPPEWRRVGTWTIPHNVSAGGDTVAFYAADASAEAELRRNLRAFGPQLPAEVSQSGSLLGELASE